MKFFKSVLYFLILANFQLFQAQIEELYCHYDMAGSEYFCDLTITNPNGVNNFKEINGIHLNGKSDEDVLNIYEKSESITLNVPSIICIKFKNLRKFILRSVNILRIEKESFENCKKLTYLDLRNNNIENIDAKSFENNLDLLELYLDNNQLSTLPENLFINQKDLRYLMLGYNNIRDLSQSIFKPLTNLRDLRLNYNQLLTLKLEWFEELQKLEILHLHNNEIEELPKSVFGFLKELIIISLRGNRLKYIHSESFSVHPLLETVGFSDNKIEAIDERFVLRNTKINSINMINNLCANLSIIDNSDSKEFMKDQLKKCFDKYEELFGGKLSENFNYENI